MATYNRTKVYLYKKIEQKNTVLYRVPVVSEAETFFYNHEPIQVIVYTGNRYKMSKMASVHLTSHRLIFISQSNSMYPEEQDYFDTCELLLSNFQSLKQKYQHNNAITFHIATLNQAKIRIDLMFSKEKVKGRESIGEYLSMAVMDIRGRKPVEAPVFDSLPTYSEAISPPPSYFN